MPIETNSADEVNGAGLAGPVGLTLADNPITGRMRVCDAALNVLIENSFPTIMYGDEWLAHQVAKKMGWAHEGPWTTRRVLAALSRTPGRLVKGYVSLPGIHCVRGQTVLCFELPAELYVKWKAHNDARHGQKEAG